MVKTHLIGGNPDNPDEAQSEQLKAVIIKKGYMDDGRHYFMVSKTPMVIRKKTYTVVTTIYTKDPLNITTLSRQPLHKPTEFMLYDVGKIRVGAIKCLDSAGAEVDPYADLRGQEGFNGKE